jgi:hypothetical protein
MEMAKSYSVIRKHSYPERDEALLSKRSDDPASPPPYDTNAPGLYPNETVVEVDGERVAVSVDTEWLPNNSGVALHGFGRWLNDDGSTKEDELGRPIETSISNTFDAGWIETHGLQKLADATAALVMGEPQETITVENIKEDGTKEKSKLPLIMMDSERMREPNIRVAIGHYKKLKTLAPRL